MADVKISLTGDELVELKAILGWEADKLSAEQAAFMLESLGYNVSKVDLDTLVKDISERLLNKLR